MLEHKSINVRRNAAWILSNLLAGDYSQVSYILIKDSLINKLMTILASSDAIDVLI